MQPPFGPAQTETDIPPAVRRQAAQWLVELQGDDVDDATRTRWQQWRAADPDHERAWQRVEAFTSQLQRIPGSAARTALNAASAKKRRQLVKSLTVAIFASGTVWALLDADFGRTMRADKRTGAGERARMTLPDGTRVELNSGTAITERFSDDERTLHLLEGEILVTTAPDAAGRSFFVQTSQGSLHALGTRFSVRALGNAAVRVAVFEGAVSIQPTQAIVRPQVLRAHEQTRFTHDAISPATPADEASIAWTQGLIVAQDMPLSQFLDELARHRPGHLGYSASVADLRVSGVYPLADTDQVLAVLETALPVKVRRVSRFWARVQPR